MEEQQGSGKALRYHHHPTQRTCRSRQDQVDKGRSRVQFRRRLSVGKEVLSLFSKEKCPWTVAMQSP